MKANYRQLDQSAHSGFIVLHKNSLNCRCEPSRAAALLLEILRVSLRVELPFSADGKNPSLCFPVLLNPTCD